VKIKDIVEESRGVITVKADEKVKRALEIMLARSINSMPILDETGGVVGMLSERDILKVVDTAPSSLDRLLVREAMSKDVLFCVPEDDLDYVMNVMTKNNIRHMPIMTGRPQRADARGRG
jgi:CBS domain-containing protein